MYIKKSTISLILKSSPLFLMLCYISGVFSPEMNIKDSLMSLNLEETLNEQSGSNLIKQLFWILIFVVSASSYFLLNESMKLKQSKSLIIFVVLLSFCLMSLLWTDYKLILIKRFFLQLILISSIFFSLAIIYSENLIHKIIYYFFVFLLLYITLFTLFFSSYAYDSSGALSAIYKGKNYLGFIAVTGFIICFSRYKISQPKSNKNLALISTVSWFFILVLSQSKTCIFVALAFAFIWLFRNKNTKLDCLIAHSIVIILACLYIALPLLSAAFQGDVSYYFNELFSSVDLTGRGDIWFLSFDSLKDNFWGGYGYGSFWGVGVIPYNFDISFSYLRFLNQSHNGYLDLYIQIGYVGILIFFCFLYLFISDEYKKLPFYLKYLFIFALIHNITESSFIRDTHFVWFFLLLCIIYSYIFDNKEKT